ncbi:MAG: hypothetical protein C0505_16005 [Leptothrix sp. (in: Bacteria)]|nr:hypothetical protein [Leptothrix sp. (in: b-proteobacteria)]
MKGAWLGWGLAVAAVATSHMAYGWAGVALAATVVVFWLLLQFSQSLRVLRSASQRPVGTVPNAVMLNAGLSQGMRLPAVLKLTRSLGRRIATEPETWTWADEGGDAVEVQLHDGRVTSWELRRKAPEAAQAGN